MKREPHVRFCEGLGVQLPWATHLRGSIFAKAAVRLSLPQPGWLLASARFQLDPDRMHVGVSNILICMSSRSAPEADHQRVPQLSG
jgi:hypothetical protein